MRTPSSRNCVDGLLERADHRAERDDDRLRVFAAVAAHQPARGAAEARLELGGDARNVLERRQLLGVREVAHFHERLGPDHRADRDRLVRIEDLARRVRRQEGVDLGLRRDVDALVGVGEDEAVHAHHHRHRQLLGELERLDVQVERFLVGLGEQLQPAAVALAHRVAVVVPDVDRRADRAVGDRHHDRQPEPRGVVDRLGHEQQPLAGGCGVGARARRRGADRDAHRRELALDVDELARREIAALHHLAEPFDDVRLRRDRIGADDVGPAERDGFGNGVRAFSLFEHGRPRRARGERTGRPRSPRPRCRRRPCR